ncbi:MAG: threonylcarbamoyl-AMP synthase [Clostridiales bacterium]|nr:threonylcarbamoyl-AMP synthase [Clostridiales bacterium]
MQTKLFTIPSPEGHEAEIEQAARLLREGQLVGLPTETVYGLGADALNADAVAAIYRAKGRPSDNPLIIHVIDDIAWLDRYCRDIPPLAYELAERFWPGPLTMILKRDPVVPNRTTGGLDTVGIRCPDHPVTQAIIRAADRPIAAPSANTSGRPSCTTAAQVLEDVGGKVAGVVDGGPCRVGVESTILDLTVSPPRLLRPGGMPLESLEAVCGEIQIDPAVQRLMAASERPRAPGMKYRHYAPKAPVTVYEGTPEATAAVIARSAGPETGVICFEEYKDRFPRSVTVSFGPVGDKREQARRVFSALRSFDRTNVKEILAQCPDRRGLGLAVGNRLKKASGFHVVPVGSGRTRVIGITGPTGAGKTTALRELEQLGARVLNCDDIYHRLLAENATLRREITARFGQVFDGQALDRKKLGRMVWQDPKALRDLNGICHKYILSRLGEEIADARDEGLIGVGIDAVALFESGGNLLCDTTVAIVAPEQERVRRIMNREDIDREYALARVHAQKPNEWFTDHCAHTLVNDSTQQAFRSKSQELFWELLFE